MDFEHKNIKDWLVNKMHFYRTLTSAITSHEFVAYYNFIITTAVYYVPKKGHPVSVCRITGQTTPILHWRVWF